MYEQYMKRILDIAIAIVALFILLIPSLLVALLIKFDSPGPIIFKHMRYGKSKKPFMVYKFRTMSVDAPSDRPTNNFKDAGAYITRFGRLMRKLSIDELPQIVNVLKGDMSVVGPRPVVLKEARLLAERDKHGVNSLKPGITGWAQVNGRDELDDVLKAQMDAHYANNLNFMTDLKCMLKTITVILTAAGHLEGHQQDHDDEKRLEVASE